MNIPQNMKVVSLLAPATDAAGRTGAYASLKNATEAWIVAHITQGNAATIALQPLQASAVAGTGSKSITNAVPIWSNLDVGTDDNLVKRTDATSYTTDAAVKNKIVVFHIDPALLDIENGFDCIGLSTGASNVANITSALLYINSRYPQATPPSATVD